MITVTRDYSVPNDTIRRWAWKNGHMPAWFGPISWEIRTAFYAAHEEVVKAAGENASQRFLAEARA